MDCDMELSEEKKDPTMNIGGEVKEDPMMIDEKEESRLIIKLRCADKKKFGVVEEVASQFPYIKSRLNNYYNTAAFSGNKYAKTRVTFNIGHGVTHATLEFILTYLCSRLYPSEYSFDFDAQFLKLEPSSILNLIQAAHSLKIKSLMDTTCKRLADKVKTETSDVHLTEELCSKQIFFHQNDVSHRKTLKSTDNMSPSVPQDSDKDCIPDVKKIFRDRRLERFINESDFVDVHVSPAVAIELPFVNNWVNRLNSTFNEHFEAVLMLEQLEQPSVNLKQLKSAMCRLEEVILGDPRFSSCLSKPVVLRLVKFLHISEYETSKYGTDIQRAVVSILSRASLYVCGAEMERDVIPVLVKLLLHSTEILFHEAVSALTHLAYTFPDRIKVIVGGTAFHSAACMAFQLANDPSRNCLSKFSEEVRTSIYCFSKFFAAVCRGYSLSSDGLPSEKVEAVLAILELQFTNLKGESAANEDIHVFACYTLLYLTYGRSLALEKETWNILMERLIHFIYIPNLLRSTYMYDQVMIIRPALGVIGNFVRWGTAEQIESLITEHDLLQSLRRVLLSELKLFQKEGCRIITNLAARRNIGESIVESGVVECLCKLLENEDSGVKLEAAWAVFNSILSME